MTDEMTTYRRADGELVAGEYSFVTEPDYFDDDAANSDCLEVIKECWVLADRQIIKFGNTSRWCYECDEDLELDEPVDGPVFCAAHQPAALDHMPKEEKK